MRRVLMAALALLLGAGCAGGPSEAQIHRSRRESDLGMGLQLEGNIPTAFEHVMRAIELDPDNAEAHLSLATLFCFDRRDFARGEHHFREALRASEAVPLRAGVNAAARSSLGVCYILAQRHQDAVVVLREAVSDPMNRAPARTSSHLGWAYFQLGQYDEALEAQRRALQLTPHFCLAWYRIAEVRAAREEWNEAEEALNRVLDLENETCVHLRAVWRLLGEVGAHVGHRP